MRSASFANRLLAVLVLMIACTTLATSQQIVQAAGINYEKIALLKWYPAIQTGNTFAIGNSPIGIAYDGANMWTANSRDSSVTKLRGADGAKLGTFAVGQGPVG